MVTRDEAFYENTLRGRVEIKLWSYSYKIKHDWRNNAWFNAAFKLPRQLVLFALVRIAAGTMHDDETPDALTYDRMYKRWERGEGR